MVWSPRARRTAAVGVAVVLSLAVVQPAGSQSADPVPSFTFSPSEPQPGQTVHFDGRASTDDGPRGEMRWYWDFEDDGTFDVTGYERAAGQADHVYASEGTFTARLRVTDGDGNDASTTRQITVKAPAEPPPPPPPPPPQPPPPDTPPPTVQLLAPAKAIPGTPSGLAALATGQGLAFAWDLDGDGSFERQTGGEAHLFHTFGTGGDAAVAVRVTDDTGRSATASGVVKVSAPPQMLVGLVGSNVTPGKAAKIDITTVDGTGGGIAFYEWDFADGGRTIGSRRLGRYGFDKGTVVTKESETKHTFAHEGPTKFTVTAHATDGSLSTLQGVVHIGKGSDYLTAIEAIGTPAVGGPSVFRNASTAPSFGTSDTICLPPPYNGGPPGPCVTKETKVQLMSVKGWKVGGDATCCTGENQITHTFTQPGKVQIGLTVIRRNAPGAPGTEESVTQTFQIADQSCDPVSVSGVTVVADNCWKVTTATDGTKAYETSGDLTVGGLRVKLIDKGEGGVVRVVPGSASIALPPGSGHWLEVSQPVGDKSLRLVDETEGFTIPPGGTMPAGFATWVPKFGVNINGLQAKSALVELSGGRATVDYHVDLPDPFKGSAPIPITSGTVARAAIDVDDAALSIDELAFGPLEVANATLRRDGDVWRGGGDIRLLGVGFDGYSIHAQDDPAASPTPTGFGIGTDGTFRYAGAQLSAVPGVPIGSTGAFLETLGFFVRADPFTLNGGFVLTLGSLFGADGCLALVIPDSDDVGKPAEFCKDENGNPAVHQVTGQIAARLHGNVRLAGISLPGNAYVDYLAPDSFFFKGKTGYTLPIPVVTIGFTAVAEGGIANASSWQAGFEVDMFQNLVCVWNPVGDDYCPGVRSGALVSSSGAALCATVLAVTVSGYVTWNGGYGYNVFSCDALDAVKVFRGGSAADALRGSPNPVAFAAQSAVTLRGGTPGAILRISGRGGAPRVRVTGPGGFDVSDAGPDVAGKAGQGQIARAEGVGATYVHVPKARGGRYTVTPLPGSPEIEGMTVAYEKPEPRVLARVTKGAGGQRVLRYRIDRVAGQRVTFFEEGARTTALLGRAGGTRGALRFTPEPGPGGIRRIVALVERGGRPRARLTVARFSVAALTRSAAPRLHLAARGSVLSARWTSVAGVGSWRVSASFADGRTVEQVLAAKTRRLDLPGFVPGSRAKVTVQGVDVLGRAGRTASRRKRRPGRVAKLRV